ncbi:1897_t:CDS:2 [Racocetra fulgida]|uniref:Eukaryotic translation initiation factor 3 subunit G n=1 Tax=Racocetra fulgida TaxID=60492 RepID=A0A9N8ZIM1_9GLOM|nr:1897_t:CDS:2 [Racocetra fulgida]
MSVDVWADEVGEEFDPLPLETFTDENGIKTVVEYKTNDDGKKVKKWSKFGEERGKKVGPDLSTTSIGEQVFLKLSTNGKHADKDEDLGASKKKHKQILCRLCKGDHFTTKCPYKDTLPPLDEISNTIPDASKESETFAELLNYLFCSSAPAAEPTQPDATGGGKYIPPSLRAGATKGSSDTFKERKDDATIRVTNLSEDTTEGDIHDLFRRFGGISRVYLARDRETNVCKGFAFVSFQMREDAAKALQAINGYGYDNLILRVEWAK